MGAAVGRDRTLAGLWSRADGGAGESFLQGKETGCEEPRGEGLTPGTLKGALHT